MADELSSSHRPSSALFLPPILSTSLIIHSFVVVEWSCWIDRVSNIDLPTCEWKAFSAGLGSETVFVRTLAFDLYPFFSLQEPQRCR